MDWKEHSSNYMVLVIIVFGNNWVPFIFTAQCYCHFQLRESSLPILQTSASVKCSFAFITSSDQKLFAWLFIKVLWKRSWKLHPQQRVSDGSQQDSQTGQQAINTACIANMHPSGRLWAPSWYCIMWLYFTVSLDTFLSESVLTSSSVWASVAHLLRLRFPRASLTLGYQWPCRRFTTVLMGTDDCRKIIHCTVH